MSALLKRRRRERAAAAAKAAADEAAKTAPVVKEVPKETVKEEKGAEWRRRAGRL